MNEPVSDSSSSSLLSFFVCVMHIWFSVCHFYTDLTKRLTSQFISYSNSIAVASRQAANLPTPIYIFAQPMRQTSFNQFQTWLHLYDAILKSFSFGFCFYYWCMNVNQLWYGKKWKSENNDGGMASMWGERGERVKESGKNQTYT